MKRLAVVDASPLFSLASIQQIELLFTIFDEVLIAEAVWQELLQYQEILSAFQPDIFEQINSCRKEIRGHNDLSLLMHLGESESVSLYEEQNADFLIIDDKKARGIAEARNVKCIGTLGLLMIAKENRMIEQLRPLFSTLIKSGRYFSKDLLNSLLEKANEPKLED